MTKETKARLILLKRKITNHSMLPTTDFFPFPLHTEINALQLAPNGTLAQSLGTGNALINNLNYSNANPRFAICFKKPKEVILIGFSMSRRYSNAPALVSSFLQAGKKHQSSVL